MARGSVRKRCQCRDDQGRRVKQCRKAHGSWSFVIDAGTNPATGRRRQLTRSGFRIREDAEEAMTKELAAMDAGSWTDDQGMKLGPWLDQWLEEFAARDRSPKTLALYRGHVLTFWQPRLGHLRLRDLRRAHVEAALRTLGKRQVDGRAKGNSGQYVEQRSAATIDSYRRTLRAALSAARRRELIQWNPADGRIDAIPDRSSEAELTLWEPSETAHFLAHVADDRLVAMYELAAYCGLRRGELCGLRWSDIDEDGTGLTVRQTVVSLTRGQARPGDLDCPICGREHIGRLFKSPKSKAGRRWLPLASPARQALAGHRERQAEEREAFGSDYLDHDLVFCRVEGEPLRPDMVSRDFDALTRRCGLPPIRLHDMRHGACSLMLSGGVPIEVVQMILGHSSPAVTRRVYAHLLRGATSEQVEAATARLTLQRGEQSVSNAP